MAMDKKKIGTDSISYQIIQKINWRSRRKCTQADLVNQISVSKTQIERYERGIDYISVEKLCAIQRHYQLISRLYFPGQQKVMLKIIVKEERCYI
jgi:transcriptional regulator with XRE-family HTH domain